MKKVKQFRFYAGVSVIMFFCSPVFSQSVLDNTQLRFFSHAEFSSAKDSTDKIHNVVEVGDIELLLTSQITDKLSVLGEVIYAPDDGLEVDRLMIKYQFNDYFHVSAGRLYVPLGLWNTTFYHQARVLTPTIDHPVMIADDADFGVLDNKDDGIQLGGENISKFRLGYKVFLSSGLSEDYENTPQLQSLTYNLFAEPVDNFKFGVSGQYQKLGAGTNTSAGVLTESHQFNILNASVMYLGGSSKFEFASEYFMISSKGASTSATNLAGFFAYAGYKINKFVPYFMYNKVNYDDGQEVYMKNNFTGSTIGIRYKISALSVLKLEAQFLESEDFEKLNRIEMMWAIGF
jgi:hypothetical protein